jgi:hypothetical protein
MQITAKQQTADITSGKATVRLTDELATAKAHVADLKQKMLNVGDGLPTKDARDLINAVGRGQLDATTALGRIPAGDLRNAAETALGGLNAYQATLPVMESKTKKLEAELELAKLGETHPHLFRAMSLAIELVQRLGTKATPA